MCDDNYLETWAGDRACTRCNKGGSYTPLIVLLGSITFIGLAIAACTMKFYGLKRKLKKLYRTGAVKWRVLFFASQVISQFASISGSTGEKRKYPQPAATVAAVLGMANVEVFSFVSLRCVFPDTHFYTNLLFKTLGPFAAIALLWIYPLVCRILRKDSRSAWHFSARMSLIFLEIIVPSTTTSIVQALACEKFDDGYYLRVQLSLACDGQPHRMRWVYYSWLMLAIYPLGTYLVRAF